MPPQLKLTLAHSWTVFILLQTLYKAFDEIAKRRKVSQCVTAANIFHLDIL